VRPVSQVAIPVKYMLTRRQNRIERPTNGLKSSAASVTPKLHPQSSWISSVKAFVKFPTNTGGLGSKQVEGGIILPLAVELPYGWGMGVMT
jgi:hypothetical protein